jgi:hypothetical protein
MHLGWIGADAVRLRDADYTSFDAFSCDLCSKKSSKCEREAFRFVEKGRMADIAGASAAKISMSG